MTKVKDIYYVTLYPLCRIQENVELIVLCFLCQLLWEIHKKVKINVEQFIAPRKVQTQDLRLDCLFSPFHLIVETLCEGVRNVI